MSLLQDIQKMVIETDSDVTVLLRMCKILSFRLKNEVLKEWADNELNGYKDKEKLPDYRKMAVESFGDFSGPFGSGIRNSIIPTLCVPEQYRDLISHSYLMEPVSSYISLIKRSDKKNARESWPANLVALVGHEILQNMVCASAWKVIPINALESVIDTIKTRILNFCLEIELVNPDAGESSSTSIPIPQEKVTQVFNTFITGSVQNVSNSPNNSNQQATINYGVSDDVFIELISKIRDTELKHEIKEQFVEIISAMKDSKGKPTFIQKYNEFIALMADHIQIIGAIVGPFLPQLAVLLSK